MSRAYANATDRADVAGQRELQLTRSQVPDFDDTIGRACSEPFVARIDIYTSNPTSMTTDNTIELPWWMPLWLWHGHESFLLDQRVLLIREECERL